MLSWDRVCQSFGCVHDVARNCVLRLYISVLRLHVCPSYFRSRPAIKSPNLTIMSLLENASCCCPAIKSLNLTLMSFWPDSASLLACDNPSGLILHLYLLSYNYVFQYCNNAFHSMRLSIFMSCNSFIIYLCNPLFQAIICVRAKPINLNLRGQRTRQIRITTADRDT